MVSFNCIILSYIFRNAISYDDNEIMSHLTPGWKFPAMVKTAENPVWYVWIKYNVFGLRKKHLNQNWKLPYKNMQLVIELYLTFTSLELFIPINKRKLKDADFSPSTLFSF